MNNLKEQFKSYSKAAAENVMVCQADSLANPATQKKMVKSVVQEEDRSRNVVIFGLPEQKDENVEERVQEVFQEIGLKPTLQATRVGKIRKDNAKRPVQVSLSSHSVVHQVLCQVKKLCQLATFSKIYMRRLTRVYYPYGCINTHACRLAFSDQNVQSHGRAYMTSKLKAD